MIPKLAIGLADALRLTLEHVRPLESEELDLLDGVDRVVAVALRSKVDSPSVDASLKDGFAVRSREVAAASAERPVQLSLLGCIAAGGREEIQVNPGTAVRVLTGARIPRGADAVVSEEFVQCGGPVIQVKAHAEAGRNILPRGCDVAAGKSVVEAGQRLSPGLAGLLAAAGHSRVTVVRAPRVGIVATGDEVVAPGQPLPDGKLYASNITTLGSWCRRYRMQTRVAVVRDDAHTIAGTLRGLIGETDALVTSGGAWTGDRDMVAQILAQLGWHQVFHRIRIGPGKAVGFGLLDGKPVFILPGGPPSNLMGFLQIALPGLLKLAGCRQPALPVATVRLASDLVGLHADWTQFIFGTLEHDADVPRFQHLRTQSRLRSMADAQAVVAIPEGETRLPAGTLIAAQMLV
jgi:molybdopterin molybdotransferase